MSDHMVVQRDAPLRVNGRDHPGQEVLVAFRGRQGVAVADERGEWSVSIPAGAAGGPFELLVRGREERVVRDVLVGEVWLASGQSNMQWMLAQCPPSRKDMEQANIPGIRFVTIPQRALPEPSEEVDATWRLMTPETAGECSAVAFFHARRLHEVLNVPVGLVVAAWGGTPAEAWLPSVVKPANKVIETIWADHEQYRGRYDELQELAGTKVHAWELEHMPRDPGNLGVGRGWASADFDDRDWPSMPLPGMWQRYPDMQFNGVVWFRRLVVISEALRGRDTILELGPVDDYDDTYVNGVRVGGLDRKTHEAYSKPRRYRVPGALLTGSVITLAVRVFDHFGFGGFAGPASEMRLVCEADMDVVAPLAGDWRYQVEHRLPPPPPDLFATRPFLPVGLEPHHRPGHNYNGMIHPLRFTSFRGVIWYQGESNSGRAGTYADLFKGLIQSWREVFSSPELPFLFVQLSNFIGGGDWSVIREAQTKALELPATAMAVTIDVGDPQDIHPADKQPVGERLANLALRHIHGQGVNADFPLVNRMNREANALTITFDHVGSGLQTTDGQSPRAFELCGEDGIYHTADARMEGDSIQLSSACVRTPCGFRYACSANPGVNLINSYGLPAMPETRYL
ncbi:MAG TPA: sialate O-acetylesterase [Kiritimatiellia bacterium]|nr:sialate O-acetylesterase [Kiritimatiellia bacterium]